MLRAPYFKVHMVVVNSDSRYLNQVVMRLKILFENRISYSALLQNIILQACTYTGLLRKLIFK